MPGPAPASTAPASTAPAIVIAGAGAGAGECGTRAAFALREQGWDGPVIMAGAKPSPRPWAARTTSIPVGELQEG